MKRPIKFRGRVPEADKRDGGKIVFGSLVDYGDGMYRFWINPIGGDRNFPVDEDSIAQLVGYDVDGKEVYEGDIVIGRDYEPKAELISGVVLKNFKLKEGTK